jgi:hypothetical protein
MLNTGSTGLYRKDDWAFVAHNSGYRSAMTREQYQNAGHTPSFDALQTEDEFHIHALGHRYGDND